MQDTFIKYNTALTLTNFEYIRPLLRFQILLKKGTITVSRQLFQEGV